MKRTIQYILAVALVTAAVAGTAYATITIVGAMQDTVDANNVQHATVELYKPYTLQQANYSPQVTSRTNTVQGE